MYKYLLGAVVSLGTIISASGAANAQAKVTPAPGTLVVHLNGQISAQMNGIWSSVNSVGGYKLEPLGMSGDFRIYPGFDAVTTNGLEYGASAETRVTYTTAGAGTFEGSNATPAAQNVTAMHVRRAWVYFGAKEFGYLRAGMTDAPWDLLSTGEYYNWGDHNNFNSDGGIAAGIPAGAKPSALFTSSGSLYSTNKVVYLSPKLMGFEAGVSFEPNSNAFKGGQQCAFSATTGYESCATFSGGPGIGSANRRRNTYQIGLNYSTTFDDFGVELSALYMGATPAWRGTTDYRGLGVTMLGAQATYAGFLVGGNVKFGQVNNGYNFLRPGARDLLFYEVTGQYAIGPYRLSVMYFNNQAAGGWTATNGADRTESDWGIGAGANYGLAKGVDLFAMYLYGHRHQAGFNLVTGTAGSAFNSTDVNAFTVGTVVTW